MTAGELEKSRGLRNCDLSFAPLPSVKEIFSMNTTPRPRRYLHGAKAIAEEADWVDAAGKPKSPYYRARQLVKAGAASLIDGKYVSTPDRISAYLNSITPLSEKTTKAASDKTA
jgi:hypothetical protein